MGCKKGYFIGALALMISFCSFSQQFVYKPKNPFFGGDTFNYQQMIASAQAQNIYTADNGQDLFNEDPLADFQNNINRQILSQLTRSLTSGIFGEDGQLQDGTYEIGDYQIEISSGIEGIDISILDILNGGTTVVTVPYF